jgi:hypothetical protein
MKKLRAYWVVFCNKFRTPDVYRVYPPFKVGDIVKLNAYGLTIPHLVKDIGYGKRIIINVEKGPSYAGGQFIDVGLNNRFYAHIFDLYRKKMEIK